MCSTYTSRWVLRPRRRFVCAARVSCARLLCRCTCLIPAARDGHRHRTFRPCRLVATGTLDCSSSSRLTALLTRLLGSRRCSDVDRRRERTTLPRRWHVPVTAVGRSRRLLLIWLFITRFITRVRCAHLIAWTMSHRRLSLSLSCGNVLRHAVRVPIASGRRSCRMPLRSCSSSRYASRVSGRRCWRCSRGCRTVSASRPSIGR